MPGHSSLTLPPIPPLFTQRKVTILKDLAVPSEAYTDLSPKGSIDAGIRDLIDRINKLEGIVTTSSCAGRVSVFLDGAKTSHGKQSGDCGATGTGEVAAEDVNGRDEEDDGAQSDVKQASVPGGKGKGGRWLFSSHEPVNLPEESGGGQSQVSSMFGLKPPDGALKILPDSQSRFVKFQFEPMILHVMTASLRHAQPVLSAAINAGFRESGVQSLKNLDDANSFPMVAIRTSGLALSSLIGFATTSGDGLAIAQALVDDNHLGMLLQLANDRFKANAERIKRFEEDLFKKLESRQSTDPDWEDAKTRRERKRAEGLREQERFQRQPGWRSQRSELSLE